MDQSRTLYKKIFLKLSKKIPCNYKKFFCNYKKKKKITKIKNKKKVNKSKYSKGVFICNHYF